MNHHIDPEQLTCNLGGKWYRSYGTAPCPVCQLERRKDQDALTISAQGEKLLLHCKKAGCDFRDILAAAGIEGHAPEIDREAMRKMDLKREAQAAEKLKRARAIWGHGEPIHGTHGEAYLRSRGITCPLPDSLRWLPDTYHTPSGSFCGAMVADVSTGGVHRTFFTKKGVRLDKNHSPKMMFGACGGGAVVLSGDAGPLVVCEGIETGLSLLCGLLSGPANVWACLSTSGIKGLTLPVGSSTLIIATDGDEPGREAGNALACRASALGWSVSLLPAPDNSDWNDVLVGKVVAA